MTKKLLGILGVLSLNASASLTSSTGSILDAINISDVTQSIVDVVGILAPTLYAFIGPVVAMSILITLLHVTGVLPKFVDSLNKKIGRI